MEDNTAGFSPVLRRRLMTVDRISGFLQGASMPLRPRVSPIVTVRAAIRYEELARDETVLARRARLAWLAYRMAMADRLFRARIQFVSATLVFGLAAFDCSMAISSSHTSLGVL